MLKRTLLALINWDYFKFEIRQYLFRDELKFTKVLQEYFIYLNGKCLNRILLWVFIYITELRLQYRYWYKNKYIMFK